ncbi:MAG: PLP-dependent aspartate aminotransferase family protein [Vicingaceae bacterium]
MAKNKMGFGTRAIHAGQKPDAESGAIMTPIYQTSTFVQTYPGEHKGYEYSRTENPTRKALEENIASLELADKAYCFASGMAAVDAALKLLKQGDEVIATQNIYGGTYRLFFQQYEQFGLRFKFISMDDLANLEEAIGERTKMLWLETPSNPTLKIIDLKAAAEISKKHGIIMAVDNTFASPYLQNPLALGADLVMHSVSKYLAGHSDVIMGALATNSETLANQLYEIQKNSGVIPGPQDCFLVLRGIKTLHLRMQRHCENAAQVAAYLKQHPKVDTVYWPGFDSHQGHQVAKTQMKDFGGMVSFELKNAKQESAFKVMSKLEVFTIAQSLGGVESMCAHPASMSHASVPRAEREEQGILDSTIRLSVGIEEVNDLLTDLESALEFA